MKHRLFARSVVRTALAVALAGWVMPAAPRLAQAEDDNSSKRNVLLIIADDLGVEMLGMYGIPGAVPPSTPTLDALAESGVVFLNCWSSPLCSPTRASIYTGLYPVHHGIYSPRTVPEDGLDDRDANTLPDYLKPHGYRVGLFGKWHLGDDLETEGPKAHGWDFAIGTIQDIDNYHDYLRFRNDTDSLPGHKYAPFAKIENAAEWILAQEAHGHPWMATVAFNLPHYPFHVPDSECIPEGWGLATEYNLYGLMITCMDWAIGELLERIGSSSLQQTTIIFVGDNGTPSDFDNPVYTNTNHLKGSIYEGGIHVPLIVADGLYYTERPGPTRYCRDCDVQTPGTVTAGLVHVTDIFQTIIEITTRTRNVGVDSKSFRAYLQDPSTKSLRKTLFAERSIDNWAVRDETYKLIRDIKNKRTKYELYNLVDDPLEADNLYVGEKRAVYQSVVDRLVSAKP